MHIHILGICGTFMTGIASIAQSLGHKVTGSDINLYPPMSDELKRLNIEVIENYDSPQLNRDPNCVIVGNVMTRGHEVIESLLERGIAFKSGPQWLAENILRDRFVIAVAGTHGKTTTSSMLTWILEDNGYEPSFLIGGVPNNFNASSRITKSNYFVIEADEYDTAFFDKRPKFLHYHPNTILINNIEYDHADIYSDIEAIKWQFHQLVRVTPRSGMIICNGQDKNIQEVINLGYWSSIETFGVKGKHDWVGKFVDRENILVTSKDSSSFNAEWKLNGSYNLENALGAIAVASSIGITPEDSLKSLGTYKGVKRRFECIGNISDIIIYDDFAHHPTAIKRTIEDVCELHADRPVIVSIELRSNTMKSGIHNQKLLESLVNLEYVAFLSSEDAQSRLEEEKLFNKENMHVFYNPNKLVSALLAVLRPETVHVFLSNGDFCGAKDQLISKLKTNRG